MARVVGIVRFSAESFATASAELAQSHCEWSASTVPQASALQATVAAMKELSTTVQLKVDSARQANQLALNAAVEAARARLALVKPVTALSKAASTVKAPHAGANGGWYTF